MESVIERINRQHFWQFHGGIHPPEQKTLTNTKPIRQLPLPEQLIIPLQQHIGRQGDLLVTTGDYVLKGQALTQGLNPMAVPVHAPTSGTITAIKKSTIAHPSGFSEICLFMQPDGEDQWKKRNICENFRQLDQHTIVQKIADAGIAGMGGAGFPTHIKVNIKPEINFLIINAAECEPYITADDLLIREHSEAIIDGINILDHLLAPAFILIGIEDNKPEAAQALINACKHHDKINVCIIPTLYPSGGEKQLIKILTGKEINSGSFPIHSGIVVQNIATCFAIADAVINDTPLIRRVVTVTGQAVNKPQNVWALLGTPVEFLLKQCGYSGNSEPQSTELSHTDSTQALPLIMGGPMMGFSLNSYQVPIVKTSNCILAPSKQEMPSAFANSDQEVECIRCGQCSDVCPSQLLPQELQWSAKAKDYDQLKKLNLSDCIDCGACAYVCPSKIPLVQYYRVAKAEIRQQHFLDHKAEQAKARFEARKQRLENEKIARELKHKQAAEARKAKLNKSPGEASSAKSAVAAALARVRAKKKAQATEATQVESIETSTAKPIAPVNKEAKTIEKVESNESTPAVNDKKAKIAAAIARAKAKKLAKESTSSNIEPTSQETELPKKVIKKDNGDSGNNTVNKTEDDAKLAKKKRIAAAIAKAKKKAKEKADNKTKEQEKAQQEANTTETSDKQHEST